MVLLFDLDGTLIDSTDAVVEGFGVAFAFHDTPCPKPEAISALIGYPLDVMFARLGVTEGEIPGFIEAYKSHYRIISKPKTYLLPEARDAVYEASLFARLGVVTTKTARYSLELLEHLGLGHYFEVLVGRENVQNPKPHPEPILLAMQKMNAQPHSTWMIGDTCLDVLSAKESGIAHVALLGGYGEESQLRSCATILKPNALEAVRYIRTLC